MKGEDTAKCICIRDHLKFRAPLSHSHRLGDTIYLRLKRPTCWKLSALCFSFCFYISGYKHHRNCCHALNTLGYQNLVKLSHQLLSGTQGTSGQCEERFLSGQFGVSGVGFCCALTSGAVSFSGDCRESGWLHKIPTQAWCDNLPVKSWLAEVVRKSLFTSAHPGFHLQRWSVMFLFHPILLGSLFIKSTTTRKTSGIVPPGWRQGLWFFKGCYVYGKEFDLVRTEEPHAVMANLRVLLPSEPTLFRWGASLLGSLTSSFQLASQSHEGSTK